MKNLAQILIIIVVWFVNIGSGQANPQDIKRKIFELQGYERQINIALRTSNGRQMAALLNEIEPLTKWYEAWPDRMLHKTCGEAIFTLTLFVASSLAEDYRIMASKMTQYLNEFQVFMPSCERTLGIAPTAKPNLRD